jgi:hypothetical protein
VREAFWWGVLLKGNCWREDCWREKWSAGDLLVICWWSVFQYVKLTDKLWLRFFFSLQNTVAVHFNSAVKWLQLSSLSGLHVIWKVSALGLPN